MSIPIKPPDPNPPRTATEMLMCGDCLDPPGSKLVFWRAKKIVGIDIVCPSCGGKDDVWPVSSKLDASGI